MAEGRAFTVKDSFQCLRLDALGFEELFRASWVGRSARHAMPAKVSGEPVWVAVRTGEGLELWERVWRGVPDNLEAREREPVFARSLVDRRDMLFLVGCRGGEPVATAVLNASADAVGLSNVFSAELDERLLFGGVVRLAHERFTGLDVVGYERGAALRAARAVGFEPLGDLTVWSWRPPA
jgi:hypothetical protein